MKVLLEIKDKQLQKQILDSIEHTNTWFDLEWIMKKYDKSERTIYRWVNIGKIKKIDWFYYINKWYTKKD